MSNESVVKARAELIEGLKLLRILTDEGACDKTCDLLLGDHYTATDDPKKAFFEGAFAALGLVSLRMARTSNQEGEDFTHKIMMVVAGKL